MSPEQKAFRGEQRRFRTKIRNVFATAGFIHIATRDQEIDFRGHKSEFDSIFLFENLVVVAEDTCGSSEVARNHLLRKDQFYQHLHQNKDAFIEFLDGTFPAFSAARKPEFSPSDIKLLVTYCSKNRLEDRHKDPFKKIKFIEDRHLQYFASLAKTLGKTMRFELFKFFGLKANDTSGRRSFKSPPKSVLDEYVQFCVSEINNVLIGYRIAVPKELWTLNRKESRALSTTAVNGIIFCLRTLLERDRTTDLDGYKTAFKSLTQDFTPKKFKYKSSHWKDLGTRIADECFP